MTRDILLSGLALMVALHGFRRTNTMTRGMSLLAVRQTDGSTADFFGIRFRVAHGERRVFELTALSDGTLAAHLSWERGRGVLELWLEDRWFGPSTSGESIVGMLPVMTGQRYRVWVADAAPWDYDDLLLPSSMHRWNTCLPDLTDACC